ncbi:hypothetical protein [Parafrankia elaeagni]|uniref:hypothetical protein n=1 Tax=Parafrankia elaeagni TaxID=222534 RepID=UPI00035CEA0D|nr:hypothetical protein [Parafrankia elaeagni]
MATQSVPKELGELLTAPNPSVITTLRPGGQPVTGSPRTTSAGPVPTGSAAG